MSAKPQVPLTAQAVADLLAAYAPAVRYWVAYSGGLDSHVLLHLLGQLQSEKIITLQAIHVNHGLSPNAEDWAAHCQQVCDQLAVSLTTINVDATPQQGESPEAAARRARYAAFESLLQHDDVLCCAHHQDDQAETLLLQLLRGAGPKGLASMPVVSSLTAARLLRPLLGFSREQLSAYAATHGLRWVDDTSNFDTGFDRNYLRHQVMPLLKQRWPATARVLSRSADHCAEAAQMIDSVAQLDLTQVQAASTACLSVEALLRMTLPRLKNVLRYWIHQLGLPLPSDIKLQHVIHDVLNAAADKNPCVHWPGCDVRRFAGQLYAMAPLPKIDASQCISWQDVSLPLDLPDGSRLCCQPTLRPAALSLDRLRQARVTIRYRQGGEVCRPAGMKQHKSLKQLFQEHRVPPWQRKITPLVYADDELVAVPNLCICDGFTAAADESACIITTQQQ